MEGRWKKHLGSSVVEEKCGDNMWMDIRRKEFGFVEGKRRMLEETIINKNYFNYEGRYLGERNLEGGWRKH